MKLKLIATRFISFIVDSFVDVFYNIPVRVIRKLIVQDVKMEEPSWDAIGNFYVEYLKLLIIGALLSALPVVGTVISIFTSVMIIMISIEMFISAFDSIRDKFNANVEVVQVELAATPA